VDIGLLVLIGTLILTLAWIVMCEVRHAKERQGWMDEFGRMRLSAETERRELYARIQRYTFPDNQTDRDREPGKAKDVFPEIYQMMSGAWRDPVTNTTHHSKEDAVSWRRHLLKSGKPLDHKPDDALVGF